MLTQKGHWGGDKASGNKRRRYCEFKKTGKVIRGLYRPGGGISHKVGSYLINVD